MRIVEFKHSEELEKLMRDIKVDEYGIRIMMPKAMTYAIKLNGISHIAANILKQEMLSLGADLAIAKDAITGSAKKTDCLLIANLSQLRILHGKLAFQPFGLAKLAQDISGAVNNYQKGNFILNLGRHQLKLKEGRPVLMGIINLTPDSFSGDGFYQQSAFSRRLSTFKKKNFWLKADSCKMIADYAEKLVHEGAEIIDIGGESSRPGAKPVPLKEELSRTIPAIKALSKQVKVPLSIDTYKTEVARQALDHGASIVNNILGLKDIRMAKLIVKYKAGIVIMHMKGKPSTMQNYARYSSLMDEILKYFNKSVDFALSCGITKEQVIIDPGIGFAKTLEHNLEILKRLKELKIIGQPILVGPSRKSFIGKILDAGIDQRLAGTLSACVLASQNGANILRAHDVGEVRLAVKVSERITNS